MLAESFEILRYLVEHLPAMVTPRWVATESQPISVRNVLHYLVACLDVPETVGATLDIGGPDILSYRDLMRVMAEARGLRPRIVMPVPVLTPRLSSLWIHLITPVPHSIARPLAEGLRNRTVCRDDRAARLMPQQLLTMRQAMDTALGHRAEDEVETAWTDAGAMPGDPDWAGGTTYLDHREIRVAASPARTFATAAAIGGDTGWYGGNWLWKLRGAMDKLIVGNEEDLQKGLGIEGQDVEAASKLDPTAFFAMIDKAVKKFPNVKVVATTLREVHSTNRHSWGAVAWVNGKTYQSPTCELDVVDRVGGGDGYAAGFIYGLLSSASEQEAVNLGWAHGALLTTFPGDTTMSTVEQVKAFAKGGSARIQR